MGTPGPLLPRPRGAAHPAPRLRSAPLSRRVFLAAFAASLGPLSFGFALGYSSPAIPSLRRASPPALRLDDDAASWFGVRPGAHPPGPLPLPPHARGAFGAGTETLCFPAGGHPAPHPLPSEAAGGALEGEVGPRPPGASAPSCGRPAPRPS